MSKTNYVLIHGQLVEVSDEVLMHWKYIKREKKNGRWVYYYHDDSVSKAKADYEHAQRVSDDVAKQRDAIVAKNKSIIRKINDEHNKKYGDKAGDDDHWHEAAVKLHPYSQENRDAQAKASSAAKRASEAKSSYQRAKRVYEKSAGHKVAALLNKASSSVNKAKNWLKSLFK